MLLGVGCGVAMGRTSAPVGTRCRLMFPSLDLGKAKVVSQGTMRLIPAAVASAAATTDSVVAFALGAASQTNRDANPAFWVVAADPFGDFAINDNSQCEDSLVPYLIWNRPCYDRLSQRIEELLQDGSCRFIILGTAGIGKSWFATVWILKLAAKRCKVVIKIDEKYRVLDFTEDLPFVSGPHDELHPLVQEYLVSRTTWLVIDGRQADRLGYRCKMLLACSTEPFNSEEFRKNRNASTLFMPAWREDEFRAFFRDFEPYRQQYSSMRVSKEKEALKLYKILGGVSRYVLDELQAGYGLMKLEKALTAMSINVDAAVQAMSGSYVEDISDPIVHVYTNEEFSQEFLELASDHVCNTIRKQLFHMTMR